MHVPGGLDGTVLTIKKPILPALGYSYVMSVLCVWINNDPTVHYTRQELLNIRSISDGTQLYSNLNERIDILVLVLLR